MKKLALEWRWSERSALAGATRWRNVAVGAAEAGAAAVVACAAAAEAGADPAAAAGKAAARAVAGTAAAPAGGTAAGRIGTAAAQTGTAARIGAAAGMVRIEAAGTAVGTGRALAFTSAVRVTGAGARGRIRMSRRTPCTRATLRYGLFRRRHVRRLYSVGAGSGSERPTTGTTARIPRATIPYVQNCSRTWMQVVPQNVPGRPAAPAPQ